MTLKKSDTLDLVKLCCRVLDDKKAIDVTVLNVAGQSSITDFLVIATATSEPHLRALRVELEKAIDAAHVRIVGMEAPQQSGWLVIDAFDVMVHLFLAEPRAHYDLERLWQDATQVPVAKLLKTPAKTRARKSTKTASPPPRRGAKKRN